MSPDHLGDLAERRSLWAHATSLLGKSLSLRIRREKEYRSSRPLQHDFRGERRALQRCCHGGCYYCHARYLLPAPSDRHLLRRQTTVTIRESWQNKRWMRNRRFSAMIVALLIGTSGCVRTTIRSGRAPGAAAIGWEERWHHGFVFGFDEFPGPVTPDALCPNGWSEVDTAIDPMQAVIAVLTLGIYTPTTVSVVCADPRSAPHTAWIGSATVPAARK
jgi:hypothetical protein